MKEKTENLILTNFKFVIIHVVINLNEEKKYTLSFEAPVGERMDKS